VTVIPHTSPKGTREMILVAGVTPDPSLPWPTARDMSLTIWKTRTRSSNRFCEAPLSKQRWPCPLRARRAWAMDRPNRRLFIVPEQGDGCSDADSGKVYYGTDWRPCGSHRFRS